MVGHHGSDGGTVRNLRHGRSAAARTRRGSMYKAGLGLRGRSLGCSAPVLVCVRELVSVALPLASSIASASLSAPVFRC